MSRGMHVEDIDVCYCTSGIGLAMYSTVTILQLTTVDQPTGFATSETGTVNLTIISSIIINLEDTDINFGTCVPNSTRGFTYVDSAGNQTQANNSDCAGGSFPDFIAINNSGTEEANVTVRLNITGSGFFNDTGSWMAYRAITVSGSCAPGAQSSYTNISVADTPLRFCDGLSASEQINMSMAAYINESVRRGGTALITFIGTST